MNLQNMSDTAEKLVRDNWPGEKVPQLPDVWWGRLKDISTMSPISQFVLGKHAEEQSIKKVFAMFCNYFVEDNGGSNVR